MLRRAAAPTVAGLALTALAGAVLNPTRLLVLDGRARPWLLLSLTALAVGACIAAARSRRLPRWCRTSFGSVGVVLVALALLGFPLVVLVAPLARSAVTKVSSTRVVGGDVTVVRTRGLAAPDSDECVDLELRVGSGLLTRYRAWRHCEDAAFGWEVYLSPDGDRGTMSYAAQRCPFTVDRERLRFVFDDPERTCGFRSS